MRNQFDWATKHRAGARRARAIVTRQDARHKITGIHYVPREQSDREVERRQRQIVSSQLKAANGLI